MPEKQVTLGLYEDDALAWFPVEVNGNPYDPYTDVVVEVPEELRNRAFRVHNEWIILQKELQTLAQKAGH